MCPQAKLRGGAAHGATPAPEGPSTGLAARPLPYFPRTTTALEGETEVQWAATGLGKRRGGCRRAVSSVNTLLQAQRAGGRRRDEAPPISFARPPSLLRTNGVYAAAGLSCSMRSSCGLRGLFRVRLGRIAGPRGSPTPVCGGGGGHGEGFSGGVPTGGASRGL